MRSENDSWRVPSRITRVRPGISIAFKIRWRLLQEFFDLRNPIVHPLRVKIVNLKGGLQIPQQNVVIDRRAVFRAEGIHILLREEQMAEIEQLQIGPQELLRHFIIQRLMRVMAFLEQAAH